MAPPPPEANRRGPSRLTRIAATLIGGLLALTPHRAALASIPIFDDEDGTRFALGGYARSLTGVQVPGLRGADGLAKPTGLAQSLARLEWKLTLGETFSAEVHHRLSLTVRSAGPGSGLGLGVGVTPTPRRSLDMKTLIIDEDGLTFDHDLDRLALRARLGRVDLTLGRQAITWGLTGLFGVSDAWAALSPFDLDTSQKRGLDALRVGLPLSSRVELDLVIADRGSLDELSGGARIVAYLDSADLHLGVAKLWRELALMAGLALALESSKLRAELRWSVWDFERGEVLLPRATLGFDGFFGDLTLTLEAHYNGAGARSSDAYLTHALSSPELERGEVFLLGRLYAGLAASYLLTPQLSLSLSAITNLADPSALIVTALRYDAAENVDLRLGAFTGIGARTAIDEGRLGSELGAYGHLVFLDLALWL